MLTRSLSMFPTFSLVELFVKYYSSLLFTAKLQHLSNPGGTVKRSLGVDANKNTDHSVQSFYNLLFNVLMHDH